MRGGTTELMPWSFITTTASAIQGVQNMTAFMILGIAFPTIAIVWAIVVTERW